MSRPRLREYSIGWQISNPAPPLPSGGIFRARGFEIEVAQCLDLHKLRLPPGGSPSPRKWREYDVLVRAKDWEHAQALAYMLWAAHSVYEGMHFETILGFAPDISPLAAPRKDGDPSCPLDAETVGNARRQRRQSGGIEGGMRLLARCSSKRRWQCALLKLFESLKLISVAWRDTAPATYSSKDFRPSRHAIDHVRFAQAITLAYGAIEELDLTVRAVKVGQNDVRAKYNDGKWVPAALADITRRLATAHVAPREIMYWYRRGPEKRHERKKPFAIARTGRWSGGPIRDVEVLIPDALDHARWIRNQLTGHRIGTTARSLSPYEVANVQGLARMLLLSATQAWWPHYRPHILPDESVANPLSSQPELPPRKKQVT